MSFTVPHDLRPGDVLLYKPTGAFGWIIRLKTWHPVGHVEVFMGNCQSTASRDGIGAAFYPWREKDLLHVLRLNVPFDIVGADRYARKMIGTPYGWLDLLHFSGFWNKDTPGIVCSPYVTNVLRAGGVPIFNDEDANDVAPFQFLTSELLTKVY